MERIKDAIAKARATRLGQPHTNITAIHGARTPAGIDAEWDKLTQLPVDLDHLRSQRIVTVEGGPDSSSFDVMRTKVIQTMRANGWRRLAITSPTPECGKSTITLNLAFSLARQPDVRTIVTELDMRRPSMAAMLGTELDRGAANVLAGEVEFADQALRLADNLAISMNAGPVKNPAELLQSNALATRLGAIEQRFAPDIMLFDMPPMFASDDAIAFAAQVDCVLLVAAAEATTVKEIDTCERELASQTNFMGVLLNKCRYMENEYGYSYYE